MLWILKRLRELFQHRGREPTASIPSSKRQPISKLDPQTSMVEEYPQGVVKVQSEELSARVVTFMHRHSQHCVVQDETFSEDLSSSSAFTLFPLLPAEIRINIWEEVISTPHTIELSCTPASQLEPQGRWFSHSRPPTVLHVNTESRTVALRRFSILNFSPDQIGAPPRPIYVNFLSAKLMLCGDLAVEWARDLLEKNEQLKKALESLVVSQKLWQGLNPNGAPQPDMPEVMAKWTPATNVSEGLMALQNIEFHGRMNKVPGNLEHIMP